MAAETAKGLVSTRDPQAVASDAEKAEHLSFRPLVDDLRSFVWKDAVTLPIEFRVEQLKKLRQGFDERFVFLPRSPSQKENKIKSSNFEMIAHSLSVCSKTKKSHRKFSLSGATKFSRQSTKICENIQMKHFKGKWLQL